MLFESNKYVPPLGRGGGTCVLLNNFIRYSLILMGESRLRYLAGGSKWKTSSQVRTEGMHTPWGESTCVQRDPPLEVPDVQDRRLQIATNPREAPSIPTRHRKVLAGATEIATVGRVRS